MPGILKRAEQKVRRVRNRIMQGKPAFPDVNHLLHELRSQAFSRLNFQADHLVSVGCAGTWYFKWIEERFGTPKKHTGVEFYSPMPDDLPDNCDWIANTAGNMPEIADQCADAVFSGQNLEHLWPEEVVGFFLESNRILKNGGHLVVDSPNRLVTSRLEWSHPEHTVELTVDEAVELCELSGFDVSRVEGIWLCVDPRTEKLLPFENMNRFGSWPMQSRMDSGLANPQQSFIWWIVATKSERSPQAEKLKQRMAEIFQHAWPERCERTKTIVGKKANRTDWLTSEGQAGVMLFGPYLPVKKGQYSAVFTVRAAAKVSPESTQGVTCEVVGGSEASVLATQHLKIAELECGQDNEIIVPFSVDDTTFGIQFRVLSEPGIAIECSRKVKLDGWQQW